MSSMHGPTYLYAGSGSWPISVDSTQEMLETVLDPRGIKRVDHFNDVDRNTRLVVVAGGNASPISHHLGITGRKVKEYVEKGGRFLGICAGGIIATETTIEKPRALASSSESDLVSTLHTMGKLYHSEYKRKEHDPNAWDFYPGKCLAPHIVKEFDPTHPRNLCAVDVINAESNQLFKACHYSGPVFFDTPPSAKVLLRYRGSLEARKVIFDFRNPLPGERVTCRLTAETISEANPVAALSYSHKAGKIVLTGIHPEISPDTFPQKARKYDFPGEFPQEAKPSEPTRKAFVNTMFQELRI